MTIEIGQNGEVTVPEELKGTWADPTIPLHHRLGLLSTKMENARMVELLLEAGDILQSNRTAAERRGKMQLQTQTGLHNAHLEISFLRNFIREKLGTSPDFVLPSPWETEARRADEAEEKVLP